MVLAGIDRIDEEDVASKLRGKRLGVISSTSGLSSDLRYPMDVLNEKYNTTALFAPEHGPRGVAGPGEKISGGIDRTTGLPVFSLFEDFLTSADPDEKERAYAPADEALSRIDMMVFDMQDAGSRYFTYVSTLFYVMRTCGKRGVPLTVLDRPNPLGGKVEGCLPDEKNLSFIGLTRVPIRHGMTVGELARFYNGEYGLGCELTVVTMSGWERDMYFDDTGLPFVRPSPNLPTMQSLLAYNGTCMLAGTNVSEGRGTTEPFTLIGGEFIDPDALCQRLRSKDLPGVRFSPAYFRPEFSKLAHRTLYGVRLHIYDKKALEPVRLGVVMIDTIREMYPDDFEFTKPKTEGGRYHIDLSTGNSDLRDGILDADAIMEKWNADSVTFYPIYEKYRLY